MGPFHFPKYEQIDCEVIRQRVSGHMSLHGFGCFTDCGVRLDEFTKKLCVELEARVAGRKEVAEYHAFTEPADWLEHFKARWLPKWALRRWPVRTSTRRLPYVVWRVCPHVHVADNRPHFSFLAQRS